jgi:hypothetical protein
MVSDPTLRDLYRDNSIALVGEGKVIPIDPSYHGTGSTDLGDLSHIMPCLCAYCAGAVGAMHGSDFVIEDYQLAVITPAKVMTMMIIDLLANGAVAAKQMLAEYKPPMTKQEYLASMENLLKQEEYQG